ncbi:hemerythrin domain-containing protein [Spongisporangium articulatum]|uniref:Hemerythrin domain-containing protein n=1 Tax=Spongisporangium articulatum TaxID=3362603 RepID=A0ABW8AH22_9ACTN
METTQQNVPDINEMYVVHRVFRREFAALPTLIRRVGEGDTRRAAVVAEHLRLIVNGLHLHHTGEDEVLWPLLLQRAAPSRELVETMQAQHARVDEHSSAVEPLRQAWCRSASTVRGEQLARAVEHFTEALFEHLELEEREILPLVLRHITVAEWQSLADHGRGEMPARQLPLMFGALLEETDDDERARMFANLPLPVRWAMKGFGERQYRRYISRVRAA